MKLAILFTFVGLLLLPTAYTLAEAPTADEVLPSTEAPAEVPPQAAEVPADGEEGADLDLEFLDRPEFQRQVRTCTEQEAASIGCAEECCLCISNMPRCTC